jgi:hypothetical protein
MQCSRAAELWTWLLFVAVGDIFMSWVLCTSGSYRQFLIVAGIARTFGHGGLGPFGRTVLLRAHSLIELLQCSDCTSGSVGIYALWTS